MIYTQVIDRDDIEVPAFSTISYHYPPPITYMFRKTLYYATVHITTLVVHDEGHACALKIEQKCFIFNSHRNSLNGTQELNLSG